MNWVVFAILNGFTISLYAFISKIIADKVNVSIRVLMIGLATLLVSLVWVYRDLRLGQRISSFDKTSLFLSVVAGLFAALAIYFLQMMFAAGAKLSIGVFTARAGAIVMGAILGIVILKEPLNLKIFAGFLLSLLGLYFLITK
jgi:uncharacterized membrane protein